MTPAIWHGARRDRREPARARSGSWSCAAKARRSAPASTSSCSPASGAGDAGPVARAQPTRTSSSRWPATRPATSGSPDPSIVSIAAVQGHAIGAGFQLALACDLRILADDAKLCMKEPALGLVPDLTGTKPLVDIVGLPRAIELCLTARHGERGRGAAAAAGRAGRPGRRARRGRRRPGRRAAGDRRGGRARDQGAAAPGRRQHARAAGSRGAAGAGRRCCAAGWRRGRRPRFALS